MARGHFRMRRCAVTGIDAVEAESRHSFSRHTHDRYGLGVIHRGAQRSLSGRGTVEAGAGDCITVNPGEVHDGTAIGAGRSWRILYLDPVLVTEAVADVTEGRSAGYEFERPVVSDRRLARRQAALFATLTAGGDPAGWQDLLLPLLADLAADGGLCEEGGVPGAVAVAREIIDDDPAGTVPLAELARSCGMSRYRLIRAFARATGLTPHAYRVQRRIDLARGRIAGGAPLAEAAVDSGFADQSHMTRVFVAKYGLSPGAYAAALRG